jgi:mRNA interferase RelE/StbE
MRVFTERPTKASIVFLNGWRHSKNDDAHRSLGNLKGNPCLWYYHPMKYAVGLKPRATKDLRRLHKQDATRVADALDRLADGLSGDVKRLTNFSPEYRLRVGQYRVLFEIESEKEIVVYRIVHRREAYR